MPKTIYIRFYEELNDFLPARKRKVRFAYEYMGNHTIKDIIGSLGVPHVEVDLILANSESIPFSYRPKNTDHISVYPIFELFDISPLNHLRSKPLRDPKFILDVHLGKLARMLRMTGFDTLYQNDYEDEDIIRIAEAEKRIILTRDVGILKNGRVQRGHWVRNTDPEKQLEEIFESFQLLNLIQSFTRCMECNGKLNSVKKEEIESRLKEGTRKSFNEFFQCQECEKLYWKGSHVDKMQKIIEKLGRRIKQ